MTTFGLPNPSRATSDTSTRDLVLLDATTAVTILAANTDRIGFALTNFTANDIWIRFTPFDADNAKDGMCLPKMSVRVFDSVNMYTGEVSAIANTNGPSISVMEW